MAVVTRLLTLVDVNDARVSVSARHENDRGWSSSGTWAEVPLVDVNNKDEGGDARVSVSARHEAVLSDGRRVVLLNDRGWSGGTWADETVDELERTARFAVGPDEAFEGRTQADMEADHWDALARVLQQQGVEVEAAELKVLPHDVELSDRVLARVARGRAGSG